MTPLADLFAQRRRITSEIVAASQATFPRGARVEFMRGRGHVRARVLENRGQRLKVVNTSSGLSYWIGLEWLVGGAE